MRKKCICGYDRNKGVFLWKIFGVAALLFGVGMSIIALMLKKKNAEYRDALIDLSDEFYDTEYDAKQRREEWQRAKSRSNRRTVEEQMSDRRVREEI